MKLAVMLIAWASFGGMACPSNGGKPYIHAVLGLAGGFAYYSLMGFQREFTSVDFLASAIFAYALSRFIYVAICPFLWRRSPTPPRKPQ